MSADAWRICPKCKASIEKDAPKEQSETLREDFEVWMDEDGEFHVDYRSHCQVCGFGHKFAHTEKVLK